jgi:hypothetical protein
MLVALAGCCQRAKLPFNARIALARRAEKSLDAQYDLIQNDDISRQFLRELRDAARRCMRVRLFNPSPERAGPFGWRLRRKR